MKTPEQLAGEQMEAFTIAPDSNYDIGGNDARDVEECSADYIRDRIIEAIEADRAQRSVADAARDYRNGGFDNTIAAAIYDCLQERVDSDSDGGEAAARAADWVAENENDALWDRIVGPMLDDLERMHA
ncbi:MAG: hypothetical protein ACTH4Y_11570 [Microbacterium gubbeenense]|uniref:hypothetical protein n=1 Tax=Microbacterium gubbeenense TaxID=159896 RepID=UPI003F94A453